MSRQLGLLHHEEAVETHVRHQLVEYHNSVESRALAREIPRLQDLSFENNAPGLGPGDPFLANQDAEHIIRVAFIANTQNVDIPLRSNRRPKWMEKLSNKLSHLTKSYKSQETDEHASISLIPHPQRTPLSFFKPKPLVEILNDPFEMIPSSSSQTIDLEVPFSSPKRGWSWARSVTLSSVGSTKISISFQFCQLFQEIPTEIVAQITYHLSNSDLYRLACTCREFQELVRRILIPAQPSFHFDVLLFASKTFSRALMRSKQPHLISHDGFNLDVLNEPRRLGASQAIQSRSLAQQPSGDAYVFHQLVKGEYGEFNFSSLEIDFRGSRAKKWSQERLIKTFERSVNRFGLLMLDLVNGAPRLNRIRVRNLGDLAAFSTGLSHVLYSLRQTLKPLTECSLFYSFMDLDQDSMFNGPVSWTRISPVFESVCACLLNVNAKSLMKLELELFLGDSHTVMSTLNILRLIGSYTSLECLTLSITVEKEAILPDFSGFANALDSILNNLCRLKVLDFKMPRCHVHRSVRGEWMDHVWEILLHNLSTVLPGLESISLSFGSVVLPSAFAVLRNKEKLQWICLNGAASAVLGILKTFKPAHTLVKGLDLRMTRSAGCSRSLLARCLGERLKYFRQVRYFKLSTVSCSVHLELPIWIPFLAQLHHLKIVADQGRALRASDFQSFQFMMNSGSQLKSISWDRSVPMLKGYRDDWTEDVVLAANEFFRKSIHHPRLDSIMLRGIPMELSKLAWIIPKIIQNSLPSMTVSVPLVLNNHLDSFEFVQHKFRGPLFDRLSLQLDISDLVKHSIRALTDGWGWFDMLPADFQVDLEGYDVVQLEFPRPT